MTHRVWNIGGLALLVASWGAAPSDAAAAEAVPVEVIVLEVGKADARSVDPKLSQETQLLTLLAPYDRIRVIEKVTKPLQVGQGWSLEFRTPEQKPAKLELKLLERATDSMKLQVKCAALQDLNTTTTHKDGGVFLVVRPQSSVAVAIRRQVEAGP